MCGCRAAIVEHDEERRESRKGREGESSRLEPNHPGVSEAVRDPSLHSANNHNNAQGSGEAERSRFFIEP